MAAAVQELFLVRELMIRPVTVRSLSDEASRKLRGMGFTVHALSDGSVEIKGPCHCVPTALNDFLKQHSVPMRAAVVRIH